MEGQKLAAMRCAAAATLAAAALAVQLHPAGAVVAGIPAEPAVAKSLVMVLAEGGVACSGVVLSPRIVLTAGHCVPKGKAIRIYAPLPDASAGSPHLIAPAASLVHPAFAQNAVATRRRSVDLALLRLSESLPGYFAPARLAAAAAPGAGTPVIVAGDGLAEEAKPNSSGKPRSAQLTVIEPYGRSAILLWAAPASGSAGACEGDSGGSMTAGGALIAVIAFAEGAGGARCGKLTQGVLVGAQRSFIDAALARWGETAQWADR
jgi:hypothetical protein